MFVSVVTCCMRMFLGRWNTSLHQLGYMIGKDVSVGYTVG